MARQAGVCMADHPFVTVMQTLHARARPHIDQGTVTPGYRADRATVRSAVTGGVGGRAGLRNVLYAP